MSAESRTATPKAISLRVSLVVFHSDLVLLGDVLASLEAAVCRAASELPLVCEVDIVNNAPDDRRFAGPMALLTPQRPSSPLSIRVIEAGANLGYGGGNNLSIRRQPPADFHLVLNPDVLTGEDALLTGLRFLLANAEFGLVTPRVIGFDDKQQYLCKRDPKLVDMFLRGFARGRLKAAFERREARYEMRDHDYEAIIEDVSYPTGCFMLFRGESLRRINGFDERFFLHYEDADIGRRLLQVARSAYLPDAVVRHKWARETHRSWAMRWITIKSGLLYFRIWGGIY